MNASSPVRIDVWSDYVCPFCYFEVPALKQLQQESGSALQIVWRAFELRPEPNPTLDPAGDYLRATWERSVYPMARERGMALKLPPVQPRSRKALEAAAWAHDQHAFDAMHEALFRAFFEDGKDIGQDAVLLEIAASLGLSADGLQQALAGHAYTARVQEDQKLAYQFGIAVVPIMLLRSGSASWDEAVPLQGAVPYGTIRKVVDRLRSQAPA